MTTFWKPQLYQAIFLSRAVFDQSVIQHLFTLNADGQSLTKGPFVWLVFRVCLLLRL